MKKFGFLLGRGFCGVWFGLGFGIGVMVVFRGGGVWEKVAGLSRIQLWRQVCFKTFMVIPAKSIFCKTVWNLSR